MHKLVPMLTSVLLLLPLAALGSPAEDAAGATLSPAELSALIRSGADVHVYDANGRDSYLDGHVPGAQWVDYDEIARDDLPAGLDAQVIFYCYNPMCGASHTAAEQARAFGFRNVQRMPEGILGWREAGLPVVAGAQPGARAVPETVHVEP